MRAWLFAFPFLALYLVVGAAVAVPFTWLLRDIAPVYWVARQGIRITFALLGVRVRTVGLENAFAFPASVFVANHTSYLDPPALFFALPRIAVIVKKELSRIPILGYVMGLGDFIYVDRSESDSRRAASERAVALLRRDISVLIYPEGTRSADGRLRPFRSGAFKIAIEAARPVAPITVLGARELLPKGGKRVRSGEITLVFHPPIPTSGLTQADRGRLMEEARRRIASALPASLDKAADS